MSEESKGKVAVIGAGVIGRSWTATFLAGGYDVVISDPQEGIDAVVREALPGYLGGIPGRTFSDAEIKAMIGRVTFIRNAADAVAGVVAVQENGPEKEGFKQSLFSELEKTVGPETLLLSSSSGITPDVIGATMKDPSRVVIGHPFNPPHQLPLVEVCGTLDADEGLITQVMAFYTGLGKVPARLKKSVPGFVANRLQTVLVMEALHLVQEGVVDIATLDQIMLNSLGPRWASVGPLLAGHLGGGDGGLGGILGHILNRLAAGMGLDPIPEDDVTRLGKLADEAYPPKDKAVYARMRDRRTTQILENRLTESSDIAAPQGQL